ncbi:MAG: tRNA (adenosine(37)-N6)-threonylcarbamoyltransferase complex dimerization subunit type 1 TsaB [Candidatus Omnitrophica bacterium]|nr:tRNA (adenosine(37)-N6)-threonylcarbamoyltransferase complex dimerization subunit type 1 TsaB [Candidatus Omnitrophota bacterium]
MVILGIDTSSKMMCIAAQDGSGKVYELRLEAGRKLSTILAPNIKRILDSLKLVLKDVDYFACATGPGSFTGIRIGLSTVKALAFAAGKPVIGISSLDILAMNASGLKGMICPVVDAKRGLIYYSLYRAKPSLKRLISYRLGSPDEMLKAKLKAPCVFLGDGLKLYKDDISAGVRGAEFLDGEFSYPRPGNIIALARKRVETKQTVSSFKLEAIYLYPKECQIRKA